MANKNNRRAKYKYPALKRDLNLKSRRYYIEADYVDGVRNENDELVIRPLTEDEKAWLNKFYEETIVTKFNKDETDFYKTVEERRALWRENNRRNTCIFNAKQKTGRLNAFDPSEYERSMANLYGYLDHEILLVNELEEEYEDSEGHIYTLRREDITLKEYEDSNGNKYFKRMWNGEEID